MAMHLPRVELMVYGPYGDEYRMPRCFSVNAEGDHCRNRSMWVTWYTGEPYQFQCTHHKNQTVDWTDRNTPIHVYHPEGE